MFKIRGHRLLLKNKYILFFSIFYHLHVVYVREAGVIDFSFVHYLAVLELCCHIHCNILSGNTWILIWYNATSYDKCQPAISKLS